MIREKALTLILIPSLALSCRAAEYHGHNIDGRSFAATLDHMGDRYKGTVIFKGKAAVLHVRKAMSVSVRQAKSKDVRLLLCNEEISDPYHIEVIAPGSQCLESEGHPVFLELEIPELDTTEWPK